MGNQISANEVEASFDDWLAANKAAQRFTQMVEANTGGGVTVVGAGTAGTGGSVQAATPTTVTPRALPGQSRPLTGDDIESELNIIEANGGLGEWESGVSTPTERYLYPRFTGADKIGTCEATTKPHEGYHDQKKGCVDWTVDMGNMYLSRSAPGDSEAESDVEWVAQMLDAPRNVVGGVMLLGYPGTGKTALAQAACTHAEREVTLITATPDHTKDSLYLRFVGEGNGEPGRDGRATPFALGPLAYAALHGHTLIVDEFLMFVDGIKPIFYTLADGSAFLPEGNVDGSALPIHPEFRLVITANPDVRGASLPEPIGSRFASTTVYVETSESMLHDLDIDESIVAAWVALGNAGLWRPQIRELRMANYWLPTDLGQAMSAFMPEHCPESQRTSVRDVVGGILGGNLRPDGRLVVS